MTLVNVVNAKLLVIFAKILVTLLITNIRDLLHFSS